MLNGSRCGGLVDSDTVSVSGPTASLLEEPTFFECFNDYYSESSAARDWLRPRACAETRLCLEVNPVLGAGRMDVHQFRSGLLLGVVDFVCRDDMEETYPFSGTQFRFTINLGGRFDVSAPDVGVHHTMASGQVCLGAGDIGAVRAHAAAGERVRGLTIDVPADMAEDWRQDGPRAINTAVDDILAGRQAISAPVRAVKCRSLEIADALVNATIETACERLHAESLVLCLLVELLAADTAPEQVAGVGARVSRQRHPALDEAMDILRAEWREPPTIAQLARRVGLNEFYLTSGFKERFGTTIASAVRTLRMIEARRLIEREGHSVQQATVAVGFSNPSHFAAAFRRVHGCLPSRLGGQRGRL